MMKNNHEHDPVHFYLHELNFELVLIQCELAQHPHVSVCIMLSHKYVHSQLNTNIFYIHQKCADNYLHYTLWTEISYTFPPFSTSGPRRGRLLPNGYFFRWLKNFLFLYHITVIFIWWYCCDSPNTYLQHSVSASVYQRQCISVLKGGPLNLKKVHHGWALSTKVWEIPALSLIIN